MDASSSLESSRVLVLNSSYEPLRIVSWRRAMILFLGQKIEVLDSYGLQVHTVSQAFSLPSVIKMKRFVRPKRPFGYVRFSRQHVFMRDDFMCQYCYEVFGAKELTLDHVVPVTRGGKTTWSNVVSCCVECNQNKGAKTPTEAGFELFKYPSEPGQGFLPDLLLYKKLMPESWRPYLPNISKVA